MNQKGWGADPQLGIKQRLRETDPQMEPEPECQSPGNQSVITHSHSQKVRARYGITRAREPDSQSQGASQRQRPERQNQKGTSFVSPADVEVKSEGGAEPASENRGYDEPNLCLATGTCQGSREGVIG